MTFTAILIAVASLAAGFAIAWAWANSSSGAARLELERRAAGLDGTVAELKKQNDSLQQEARVSQRRIEDEQNSERPPRKTPNAVQRTWRNSGAFWTTPR